MIHQTQYDSLVSALPEVVTSRDGTTINPKENEWLLMPGRLDSIDFSKLKRFIPEKIIDDLKVQFILDLSTRSDSTIYNYFYKILQMYVATNRAFNDSVMNVNDVQNYYSMLTKETEYKLGYFRGFIKRLHSNNLGNIEKDTITAYDSMKIRGNTKGHDVLFDTPYNGPLTDIEYGVLLNEINSALINGVLEVSEYLIFVFSIIFGVRPIQLYGIKIKNFIPSTCSSGSFIKIPRAKQRKVKIFTQEKIRKVNGDLAILIQIHIDNLYSLFANTTPETQLISNTKNGTLNVSTISDIQRTLARIPFLIRVYSHRTNGMLHYTATRGRRTLGTRARREGLGEYAIAELLDHTDTQNVGVYSQFGSEIIEDLSNALDECWRAPIMIYKGRQPIPSPVDFHNQLHKEGVIRHIETSRNPLGQCKGNNPCYGISGINCYLCTFFQPWIEGHHQKVYDYLIEVRGKLLEKSDDLRMASVNDSVIFAIQDVLKMINKNLEFK